MTKRSIAELAMEWVIAADVKNPNAIAETYILYSTMVQLVGLDAANKAINEARQILKLIIPGG
jgi:hypothetical protein